MRFARARSRPGRRRRSGGRRPVAPAVAAALLVACCALVVSAASAGSAVKLRPVKGKLTTKVGIADQKSEVFADQRLRDLGLRYARRSVAWDALRFPDSRADLDAWVQGAQGMGAEPLITLARSRKIAGKPNLLPTGAQFLTQFKALRKRYPGVKTWSTWNEANQCGTGTCHKPELVARWFNIIRRNCIGCRVVAADLLDQPNAVSWAQRFRRAAKYEPKYWGLHDYIDANRFQTTRTAQLLRAVRGEVWLTEIGGLVARRNGSLIKLPQGVAHASRATRFIFDRLARLDRRVGRVYLYHWSSSTPRDSWDSALIGPDGQARPSLAVVKRVLRR